MDKVCLCLPIFPLPSHPMEKQNGQPPKYLSSLQSNTQHNTVNHVHPIGLRAPWTAHHRPAGARNPREANLQNLLSFMASLIHHQWVFAGEGGGGGKIHAGGEKGRSGGCPCLSLES